MSMHGAPVSDGPWGFGEEWFSCCVSGAAAEAWAEIQTTDSARQSRDLQDIKNLLR